VHFEDESLKRLCEMTGCGTCAAGYGNLCEKHKARRRRHGSPDQQTIRKADLKPFVAEVHGWIDANPDNRTWQIAEERWTIFVANLHMVERKYHTPTRQAVEEVRRIARSVPARDVAVTVLAMYLMLYSEQWRFKTEAGFRAELVRRVRSLCSLNTGSWTATTLGKPKKALNEIPPLVSQIMSGWLVELLGQAGVYLARKSKEKIEEKAAERADFAEALGKVKLK
jgi:hypothetical protein